MSQPQPGPHLAYLVSRYPSISLSFVLREIKGLRALGFSIDVISIGPPDRPAEQLSADERREADTTRYVIGSTIPFILGSHLHSLLGRPLRYFSALLYAIRLARTDLRDLLYHLFYFAEAAVICRHLRQTGASHCHFHFVSPAGLIAAHMAGASLSHTVHGTNEFYNAEAFRVREKVAASSFVCTIGNFTRSQLMYLTPPSEWNKFEIAPLGVNTSRFAPSDFRNDPQTPEVLCVGRLVIPKGQLLLIEAISLLRRQGLPVLLRIVGDGPDRQAFECAVDSLDIRDSVRFEGNINQDFILDFYRRADVFGLASFAEGIPVVLMEAMAMRVPCVATRIGGIPDLIRDGIDGILVSPSDVEGLAEAIRRLIGDPALRRRLGEAGRERVLECYDLEKNIVRLAEVFRRRLLPKPPVRL